VAVAINLLLFLLAVCVLYGLASGVWYLPFIFWTFILLMFGFITLYCGIILLNVLTESWILPMILTYLHMAVLSALLSNREETLFQLISAPWLQGIITGLFWLLPQINDVIVAIPESIFASTDLPWVAIIQCTAFAAITLGLAAWRFERRDF
jgi:ABC-type transport system involved in multi-copper enzyme maturation permease subunit